MNVKFNSEINSDHKEVIDGFLLSLLPDGADENIEFVVVERKKFSGVYEVGLFVNGCELLLWRKIIFFRNEAMITNVNSIDAEHLRCSLIKKIADFKFGSKYFNDVAYLKKYYLSHDEIIPVYVLVSEKDDFYSKKIINAINEDVIYHYSGRRGGIPSFGGVSYKKARGEVVLNEISDNNFIVNEVIVGSGVDELGVEHELFLSYDGKTSKYETLFSINDEKILTGFGRHQGYILNIVMDNAGKGAEKLRPYYRYFNPSRAIDDSSTVSAHNYAHEFYKYLNDTYQYKGLDGEGGIIVSFPHAYADNEESGANAAYHIPNGQAEGFIKYGEGYKTIADGVSVVIALNPLRCYDCAIHEFTHGITFYMFDGNIEFIGEPGGVNEYLSDVMAFLCTENWEFGEENIGSYFASIGWNVPAWRSYSSPSSIYNVFLNDHSPYPEKYSERYEGNEDNGGVHINITIPGKATWLMTLGGEHNGVTINSPLGYEKMKKILFNSYKYLTAQSNYHDIRFAFIQSATDLYPDDTWIVETMSAAFDSVELFERTPVLG